MKPLSWDKQLGLVSPLESAASQSGQTNNPSRYETGLDASHHIHVSSEGRGKYFFLDILFNRMSVHMRSQDAIYGMTNDAPAFSFIHEMLHVKLRDTCYPDLQMGGYHHTADSFHVYERHFKMLDELCKDDGEFTTIEVPRISGAQEVDYLRSCSWMTEFPSREFEFIHWLTDAKLQVRSEIELPTEKQQEKGITLH
ncbi:MAG: hypothetical protein WAN21_02375 [Candidatus Sulfotelmatobacter sp.]|jgi:hypothetical protein